MDTMERKQTADLSEAAKKNREIAHLTVEETENMLKEQITQLFIQILYADESIAINK